MGSQWRTPDFFFSTFAAFPPSPQSAEVVTAERLYQMARVFAELGNRQSCLEYLGKALSAGFSDGRRLMSDTVFEKFYEDAEFIGLIALYGIEGSNS